jgi:hypothetical protein
MAQQRMMTSSKIVDGHKYDWDEGKGSGPNGTDSKGHWSLAAETEVGEHPGVICVCGRYGLFKIAYTDSYETTAICTCGNKFVVHSG